MFSVAGAGTGKRKRNARTAGEKATKSVAICWTAAGSSVASKWEQEPSVCFILHLV